jgi:single-stranded-DNA-specific exonuclease
MKWHLLSDPPKEFLDSFPDLPDIVCKLLWHRDIRTQTKVDEFFNSDYLTDIHDPFLFQDMNKAVDIIFTAIAKKKNIIVHGDYDADGVCSTAILIKTLKKLGAIEPQVFIPHREIDGYGLSKKTVKFFIDKKIDLVITCDCGITNHDEVVMAKEAGMKVIITDHHSVPTTLPPADAIIHTQLPGTNYPHKDLCGAGVAFKVAQALLKKHQEKNQTLPDGQAHIGFEKWLLDLVAIATIGDMVALSGESRALVKYGLIVLNKTQNIGLKKLFAVANLYDEDGKLKKNINSETVSFQIVPRLNAAGRMDHANTAYALLVEEDEEEAEKLAIKLQKNNSKRQSLTEKITAEAIKQIKKEKQEDNPILFAFDKAWSAGLVGLIAGKIKDIYYRPVIIMGKADKEITGSGRSIKQFNIIKALQEMPEFFSKFGGHPQACGFSLKDKKQLKEFKATLLEKAHIATTGLELVPEIDIDAEVDLAEVDWKFFDLLQKFAPFGQTNEEPKYLATNLTVARINPVGQDKKHLQIMVKHNSHTITKTIAFGFGDIKKHPDDWTNLQVGDKIDLVFKVSVNEWNGNRELQLGVEAIKKSTVILSS